MEAPYFNQKISLQQIAQHKHLLLGPHSPAPFQNHITWQQPQPQQKYELNVNVNGCTSSKRRNIFQKFPSKYEQRTLHNHINHQGEKQKSKLKNKLSKAKSHPQGKFPQEQFSYDPDKRIEQINQQLKQHRQNLTSSRAGNTYELQSMSQKKTYFAKIQEKLAESKEILKRQEQILTTKIPTFQKKIEDNSVAISEVTKLLKHRLVLEDQKVEDLLAMMQRSQGRLRNREEQLSKINSQLLLKDSQIMKNKESNKRSELQLLRIKRIQDLQNKNLQMYHQIQKKQLSQLQNMKLNGYSRENEDQCWGQSEDESQVMVNKLSTIHYSGDKSNHSQNDTIGELLSPLALSEHKYFI